MCYKFTKTKNSISLDSRFVDLENIGERATLTPEDDLLQWWKMEAERLPILATLTVAGCYTIKIKSNLASRLNARSFGLMHML